jgi:hypothetical protein
MYDNVDFKLRNSDVSGIDFLSETPCYFDVTGEHCFNGETVISGTYDDFRITVSKAGVKIKDGSLCKWYLGDNFQTLGRSDVKRVIEKLSDTLHLPIDEATVTRLDIAQNFIVKHPVGVYYNHLGDLKYSKRSPITNGGGLEIEGLYYFMNSRGGLLLFYNKEKEQREKRRPVSELYKGRNVLRYEQRYHKYLHKSFNVERVTGAMLYDEKFYINAINRWRDNYRAIKKINDTSLNFEAMKGKTDLYNMGVLALVEMQGGELNFISQINEAQKSGQLSKKQAFDMRQAVQAACREKAGITAKNDCILELDKKVNEAVKFYR